MIHTDGFPTISSHRESTTTYKIIRFKFDGLKEVVDTGLTLEEAQEHCQREDTHGDGWFDGYTEE